MSDDSSICLTIYPTNLQREWIEDNQELLRPFLEHANSYSQKLNITEDHVYYSYQALSTFAQLYPESGLSADPSTLLIFIKLALESTLETCEKDTANDITTAVMNMSQTTGVLFDYSRMNRELTLVRSNTAPPAVTSIRNEDFFQDHADRVTSASDLCLSNLDESSLSQTPLLQELIRHIRTYEAATEDGVQSSGSKKKITSPAKVLQNLLGKSSNLLDMLRFCQDKFDIKVSKSICGTRPVHRIVPSITGFGKDVPVSKGWPIINYNNQDTENRSVPFHMLLVLIPILVQVYEGKEALLTNDEKKFFTGEYLCMN